MTSKPRTDVIHGEQLQRPERQQAILHDANSVWKLREHRVVSSRHLDELHEGYAVTIRSAKYLRFFWEC
jgi:hypothetical protein